MSSVDEATTTTTTTTTMTSSGTTLASTTPSSSMLVSLMQTNTNDAFRNVLSYIGNPFDFRRLSQSCPDMNQYFSNNDDIWKLTPHYKEYKNDDRLSSAFEKAMVGAVVRKVRREQRNTNSIWEEEFESWKQERGGIHDGFGRVVTSFVDLSEPGPRFYETSPVERIHRRMDTMRYFTYIVEANCIDLLERAIRIVCKSSSSNNSNSNSSNNKDCYPCLDLHHLELLLSLDRPANEVHNIFHAESFPFQDINLGVPPGRAFRIVRRMTYRAGIVKITLPALWYMWNITRGMFKCLWNFLRDVDMTANGYKYFSLNEHRQHLHNHMHNYPPSVDKNSLFELWVPIPSDVERAAKKLGLRINKVYDDGGNNSEQQVENEERDLSEYYRSQERKVSIGQTKDDWDDAVDMEDDCSIDTLGSVEYMDIDDDSLVNELKET